MRPLRLAAWNVAWFARLFDRRDRLMADGAASAMPGVTRRRQAEAIAAVLARIDPDLVAVIEAPNSGRTQSCVTALERFAAAYGLRQRAALSGFESPTHQEIALLFDPDRIAAEHAPIGEALSETAALAGHSLLAAPRFDSAYAADGLLLRFSKPPLEAAVEDRASRLAFRLIAVHLKSKAPNIKGSREALLQRAAENRARQRAQAAWVRARVEEHLGAGEELAVLGDFNDGPAGPGEDRSSVEIVAGDPARPGAMLRNPFLSGPSPGTATARFPADAGEAPVEALVDFILLSPGLAAHASWRIWHPDTDPGCRACPALAAALGDASDHFPVTADLAFPDNSPTAGASP